MSKTIQDLDRSYFNLMADLSQYDYNQEQQDEVDRVYNEAIQEAKGE